MSDTTEKKILFDLAIDKGGMLKSIDEVKAKLKAAQKELGQSEIGSEAYNKTSASVATLQGELSRLNTVQKINDALAKNQKGSIAANRAELSKLRQEYLGLAKPTDEQRKKIKDLTDELKKQEEAIGVFSRNVGNYKDTFKDIGIGAITGQGSIGDAAAGIASLVPGLALAAPAIASITDGVKDATAEFIKMRGEIRLLTGASGEELDKLAAGVKATAETFDKDYNEVIRSSNTLAKEFNITQEAALNLVNKGFLSGADVNGEFLDTVREYSTQFKAAGIEAEGFVSIISQNVKDGIFSDKGADVIKEAGLRIREQTKATVDALKPLGEASNKAIRDAINSGDTFKAIQLVSKGLTDVTLTATETQTIIADVFGGPGEDAGLAYLQSLQDINLELDKQIDNTNELTRQQRRTLKLNEEFNTQLNEFVKNFEGSGETLSNLFTDLGKSFLTVTNLIIKQFKIVGESAGGLKDIILGALTLDSSLITKGLTNIVGASERVEKQIQQKRLAVQKETDEKEAKEIEKRLAKQAEFDKKAADEKSKKAIEEAEKLARQLEELRLKDIARQKAKLELELLQTEENSEAQLKVREKLITYVAQAEMASTKLSAEERALVEAKANKQIEDLRKAFLDRLQKQSTDALKQSIAEAKELLDLQKATDEFNFNQILGSNNKADKQANIVLTEQLLNEEITRQEFEQRKEQRELEALQRLLELNKEFGKDTLALEQQIADKKLSIKEKQIADEAALEQAKFETLQAITSAAGELLTLTAKSSAQAADFQKAITLFQIGIDTARAISGAIAGAQTIPFPGNIAAAASGIATVLANIAQAKKILSSTDKPNAPSFEYGGMLVGGKDHTSGGTRFYSPDSGQSFEAQKDELITVVKRNDGKKLSMLSRENVRRGGRSFFEFGGIEAVRSAARPMQEQSNVAEMISSQVSESLKHLKIYTQVTEIQKKMNEVTENKISSELR